jgi:hypothetical protein
MVKAPAIHAWARDDLAKLRQSGLVVTDDEVAWLSRLAARAHEAPGRASDIDRTSPLVFAGAKFWPLTLKAEAWFARWYEAFDGSPHLVVALHLFAHHHSKPGDRTLDDLGDPQSVSQAALDWYSELPFALSQIPDLQQRLMDMTGDVEGVPRCGGKDVHAEHGSSIEAKLAALCALFEGTTPDYWLHDVSASKAYAMAAAMQARENGDEWAQSPERSRRIADYLNAIKWIARRGLEHPNG